MNILSHIHIHRIPNPSGVGRVIDQILHHHEQMFPQAYHRMLVARHLYDQSYSRLSDRWKKVSFIPHTSSLSLQQARWIWRERPLAEHYWPDVDVVYCPAESFVPTRHAKLVCTIHDVAGFEEGLFPNDFRRRLHCAKWRMLFKKMEQHADAVVTVSKFSASRIARYFPMLEGKLHVVYNAPHPIFGSATEEAHLAGNKEPYILVPGGLSLRKNADVVVKAAPLLSELIPHVKIVIAGKNDAFWEAQLEARQSGGVEFAGYVSDAGLNALYRSAAVVWFPSRYEGFGMPVVEAMAAGAPVVASNVASIPEVAGNAAILCGVNDPGMHAEAIASLVSDAHRRNELSQRGLQQAAKFSWASSATSLDNLFQSLVQ